MSYVLEDGEVVLLRDENVSDASGKNVALLLTNKHLIRVSYDFWGNGTDNYFALARLRESNGVPNVRIGKSSGGKSRLELYFEQSQQFYTFKGFLEERKWASAITKAYKARMKEIARSDKQPLITEKLFAPVKDKIDAAKDAITQREQKLLSVKCPSCGAKIDGRKGEEVTCAFCESRFVIK